MSVSESLIDEIFTILLQTVAIKVGLQTMMTDKSRTYAVSCGESERIFCNRRIECSSFITTFLYCLL